MASAVADLAPSSAVLIGSRAAQGIFGALLIPQGMAIMAATFPKPMLQKAFSVFAPMLGVFTVAGPILGGVLIDANLFGLEWRPIFLINVVIGGVALVMAVRFLPTVPAHTAPRIDVLSSGLLYVLSLFFQLTLEYTPTQTSLALIPLTVGIMAGSGIAAGLVAKLARRLVAAGLLAIIAGIAAMLVLLHTTGLDLPWWQLAISTLMMGIGAGICFSSIFNTALGDVSPEEAGSASGSLSAVQQVANGIGSALVTSIFLALLPSGDLAAVTATLLGFLALIGICLLVVPLLPKTAAPDVD
nr:MFS transporter [Microbacterium endophyticum]